jgi:hypothetical protein
MFASLSLGFWLSDWSFALFFKRISSNYGVTLPCHLALTVVPQTGLLRVETGCLGKMKYS